jgi:hypothetical protein
MTKNSKKKSLDKLILLKNLLLFTNPYILKNEETKQKPL